LLLGVEHCFGQGVHKGLPIRCKLRIPESMITGDTRRVIRSVVKRETAQTVSQGPEVTVKWETK
jgi:hypothetical protein